MKLNRKAIECLVLVMVMGFLTATAAVAGSQKESASMLNDENNITAGVCLATGPNGLEEADVEALSAEVVSANLEEAADETVEATDETVAATEETEELEAESLVAIATQEAATNWDNQLMVNVKDSLNVRKAPSEKSDVVGKMFAGAAATVLENDGEWVKIESGNVKGYVKASYCVFADEALALAKKSGCYYAVATQSGVRVRENTSTDAKILTTVDKNSRFKIAFAADQSNEWVGINYKGKKAYICADYVDIKLIVGKALTMKEYAEELAAEEAAKKAKEESSSSSSSSASSSSSSTSHTQGESVSASVDDTTLLAAIIQCEAGGESYEGKLAVGAVIINRVHSGSYPSTISGVIYQRGQFGPASSGKLARLLRSGDISSSCRRAAEEAISGVDNVDGALHFRSSSSGVNGIVIGGHVFY